MMFQKRIDRAFQKLRDDRKDKQIIADKDEIVVEKGDFGAMLIAGFQMLVLPALGVLLLIAGIMLLTAYLGH